MRRYQSALLALLIVSNLAGCEKEEPEHGWLSGDEFARIDTVSRHLRGNDVVMWEVDYRHRLLYEAILAENREYAKYQVEKIELSMRQGMERRPKRKTSYEWFFETAIPPMMKALDDGDALPAFKVFASRQEFQGFSVPTRKRTLHVH